MGKKIKKNQDEEDGRVFRSYKEFCEYYGRPIPEEEKRESPFGPWDLTPKEKPSFDISLTPLSKKLIAELGEMLQKDANTTPHGHPIRDAAEMEHMECPYPPDDDLREGALDV